MKKIILLFLAIFVVGSIAWYATWNGIGRFVSESTARNNNKNFPRVELTMTKGELLSIMGKPERVEAYTYQGRIIEFMFYRIRGFSNIFNDPLDNFIPIAIENKNWLVLAIDRDFYRNVLESLKGAGK